MRLWRNFWLVAQKKAAFSSICLQIILSSPPILCYTKLIYYGTHIREVFLI